MTIAALLAAFVLVEGGRPMADIVIPEKANGQELLAAEELKYHLDRMTGGSFLLVRENELGKALRPNRVYVGLTEAAKKAGLRERPLEAEERRLKTEGRAFYLLGGDRDQTAWENNVGGTCRGTSYAVYDFLQHEGGVRWLWPGKTGEVIPKRPDFSVGEIDRGGIEPLSERIYYSARFEMNPHPRVSVTGFVSRVARDHYYAEEAKFVRRHRLGNRRRMKTVEHSFEGYWQRYGKTHPEWFQLRADGRRGPLDGDYYGPGGGGCTLCSSNPELWRQIVADRRPDGGGPYPFERYYNCCENDSPLLCRCANCRAWDAPDPRFDANDWWKGGAEVSCAFSGRFGRHAKVEWGEEGERLSRPTPDLSDRMAHFLNAVLAEARRTDPAAHVIGYAYANYTEGPRLTKLEPGVMIWYVPRGCYPYRADESARNRAEWDAWRKAGATEMVYRPNITHMGGGYPIDCGRIFTEDFAYYAGHGMTGFMFDSLMGAWSSQAMMMYALFRHASEPTLGYDRCLDEMCATFGPAEKEIRAYFSFIEKYSMNFPRDRFKRIQLENPLRDGKTPGGGVGSWGFISADFYTERFFERCRSLLAKAAAAAASEPECAARVDFLAKGIEESYLARQVRIAQKKGEDLNPPFRRLMEYRAAVEGDCIQNFDTHAARERDMLGWPVVDACGE